ncbi:kinase-like domain-containing protein [Neurospora hispaniola]|uniref:Kinase-like domain-containing protein n=1 Tax=Neurospora hispaniola TaxID=588809 RepID=A0AAJ0I7B1_9PEZI|nr:kinase-like domain-containing protein [Neurospora hispaniola]
MSTDSAGSQASQAMLHMLDYISTHDHDHFEWDDHGREESEAWLRPVQDAGLSPQKHKVFNHANKEYLKPPQPFIQIGPELGDSGSTIVYKVSPPDDQGYRRPLALKVIVCKENARPPGPDSNVRKLALQEVRNMVAVRHPHIVVYVASFEDYCISNRQVRQRRAAGTGARTVFRRVDQQIKRHILGIAMYPPAQCNLRTLMLDIASAAAHSPRTAEEENWMVQYLHSYFGCLSQAVSYLHKSTVRIRHKDIKPENVVIDDFGFPLLTDFGLSKHFETGQHSQGPTAKTLKYADPEAMQETQRDERSDVFSLGCVFLEMVTVLLGKPPSHAEEQLERMAGNADQVGEFKYTDALDNLQEYIDHLEQVAEDQLDALPSPSPDRPTLSTNLPPSMPKSQSFKQREKTRQIEREASLIGVIKVLRPIRRMMDHDYHVRPYARDLYPLFRHLYDIYESPGRCENCEEQMLTGRSRPPTRAPTIVGVAANGRQLSLQRTRSNSPTLAKSPTAGSFTIRRVRANSLYMVKQQASHSPTEAVGIAYPHNGHKV